MEKKNIKANQCKMSGIIDLTSPNHNDNNDANQNHVNNDHYRPTNNNNNNNNPRL